EISAPDVAPPPPPVVPASMAASDPTTVAKPLPLPPAQPLTAEIVPTTPTPMAKPAAPPTVAPAATAESLADQVKALQKVEFQRLREEGLKVQTDAKKLFERGETDAALELLEAYMAKVGNTQLEPNQITLLQRPIDQRMQTLKVVKFQKDFDTKIGNK